MSWWGGSSGKQSLAVSLMPGRPLGLSVLSCVVEEADLTLLPMQKEDGARHSSLRGQKVLTRTRSLSLSLLILA